MSVITQAVTPGQTYKIPINQGVNAFAVEIWNGTPFDLNYSGFGVNSDVTIVAGTGHIFYSIDPITKEQYINTGTVIIMPVNNNNISGTGVVNIVIYKQGEPTPGGRIFPVAIPTQVVQATVSSVQTLSNETSTLGAEIIDIGTGTNTKMIDIFNDHFIWSVIQSGVVHQILKGQNSGIPLVMGQAGDFSQVLGSFDVVQNLEVDGNETIFGTSTISGVLKANGGIGAAGTNTEILGKLLIDQAATAGPFSGSVGGTIQLYEFTIGPFKIVLVDENSYNSSTINDMTLPTAFTTGALMFSGGIGTSGNGGLQFISSASAQNLVVINSLAAGGGGVSSLQNTLFAYSLAELLHPFDTIRPATTTGSHTARVLIVGV